MWFNSLEFFCLLAFAWPLYLILGRLGFGIGQILLLFVSSLVFYAWETPLLLVLLLASVVVNAAAARSLARKRNRTILILTVVLNLLVLAIFKYADLLWGTLVPEQLRVELGMEQLKIPLPVGISFYTFQGISLLIDVWRERSLQEDLRSEKAPLSSLKIWNYIAFFPQLVAGPIVKARDFLPQYQCVRFQDLNLPLAARFLIIGYFLKMVVADNLKDWTSLLSTPGFGLLTGADLILVLYGYSFQIFADFAGYSSIAVGLGLLFGFRFPQNFRLPYLAASFSEFWSRWHISLSSWLREYLYFPLGGNRKGPSRTYFNLAIVMLLGGLWHGAGWNYLVWGGAHGLLLILERIFAGRPRDISEIHPLLRLGRIVLVFHLVSVLWLLFVFKDLETFVDYWKEVARRPKTPSANPLFTLALFSLPVILMHAWGYLRKEPADRLFRKGLVVGKAEISWAECLGLGFLLALVLLNAGSSGEFIYFQF